MKKIRINDFYQEIEDEVITYDLNQYKDNILDIKKFYLHNLLSKTKIKYFITKLITFLVEIIDVLVLSYVLILDGDLTIELFISDAHKQ